MEKYEKFFTAEEMKELRPLIAPPETEAEEAAERELMAFVRDMAELLAPPKNKGRRRHIKAPKPSPQGHSGPHAPLKTEGDDIKDSQKVTTNQRLEISDPRKVPEYEIKYKQAVTTEDVSLGMSFKTPATASCEWPTVLVKLPGESMEKVELSVESDFIDIRSPRYRLHLPTPHPVDPNASSAEWNVDKSTLSITLRMTRELDLVNF